MPIRYLLIPFMVILLSACAKVNHLAEARPERYHISPEVQPVTDQTIEGIINPYKQKLDAEMNAVIGQCASELTKQKPESSLGNWMSDLLQEESQKRYEQTIDFAVINYGGIRIPALTKGPITRGKIFELMPFDNQVVVLKVKGDIVLKLFERMADYGGWPVSQSVQFKIRDGKPEAVQINGEALQMDRLYRIAISDFVANGGDKCFFFRGQARDHLQVIYRDMIIEHVEAQQNAGKAIDASIGGRVVVIDN